MPINAEKNLRSPGVSLFLIPTLIAKSSNLHIIYR